MRMQGTLAGSLYLQRDNDAFCSDVSTILGRSDKKRFISGRRSFFTKSVIIIIVGQVYHFTHRPPPPPPLPPHTLDKQSSYNVRLSVTHHLLSMNLDQGGVHCRHNSITRIYFDLLIKA